MHASTDPTHRRDEPCIPREPSLPSLVRRRRSRDAGRGGARWIARVAALALALCTACSRAPRRPNVLLVTLDTTRADALGCYAGAPDRTPNLDALAAEGTRFDLAISTAALTPVAHASILTGLDNARHGLRVLCAPSGARLPDDVPTLATILRDEGWSTHAALSAFPVSAAFGFERGFDDFDDQDGAFAPDPNGSWSWDQSRLQRRADATTDRALEYLESARGPFCLWVHYWDPHDGSPDPPAEFVAPEFPRDERGGLVRTRRLYAAKVRFMDREIGRLLDALRRDGRYDDTIVVVVADHGEGLGDHGWSDHRILYQEQIRVPLLVRVPGGARVHAVSSVVRATDVLPTILDHAGVAVPAGLSGRTLRPLMEGRADEPRVAFADEINGYDLNVSALASRPQDDFGYAVVEAPWKFVYRPLHPERNELYDLARDPQEAVNRFGQEPAIEQRLMRRLAEHGGFVTAPFPASAGQDPESVARTSRHLGTLGYVADGSGTRDARFATACPEHGRRPRAETRSCGVCGGALLPIRRD